MRRVASTSHIKPFVHFERGALILSGEKIEMKFPKINWSKITAAIASAGAVAGTIVNAAGSGQVHVPSSVLTALIALAWLGQSPLVAGEGSASIDTSVSTKPRI